VADDFGALVESVRACRRCATMDGRRRVLGPGNGPARAHVMLVGEAPGRLGAERSGVPFGGDMSGRRLDRLLAAAGWERGGLFITNAVLCNPRDARGRNRAPTAGELGNCREHLARTLELVRPRLVVALGRRAAGALGRLRPHRLATAAPGEVLAWCPAEAAGESAGAPAGESAGAPGAPWIAWVLHPSPLTQTRRPFAEQCADWRRLAAGFAGLPTPAPARVAPRAGWPPAPRPVF
jgi:uracil-DNA glycosylase family 4